MTFDDDVMRRFIMPIESQFQSNLNLLYNLRHRHSHRLVDGEKEENQRDLS